MYTAACELVSLSMNDDYSWMNVCMHVLPQMKVPHPALTRISQSNAARLHMVKDQHTTNRPFTTQLITNTVNTLKRPHLRK